MPHNLLKALERSAQIILAPPNVVTNNQRQQAEAEFLRFHKTKCPYQLCRYILENSAVEFVHFQAATVLKLAIIREWQILSKEDRESLHSYLIQFVVQHSGMAGYIREQLLVVVAIMVKRSYVDGGEDSVDKVLTTVSQLMSSGNSGLQLVGCSILSALLNEYSGSTKSSDVGLTLEAHLISKKKFETSELKKIFQYCLQGLNELVKVPPPVCGEAASLLKRFLTIAEQVLSWNFHFVVILPRKLISVFESQQSPTFRPGPEWKDLLLEQPNVLELFFKLHWFVRNQPDLCHQTLQCLNQLASLHGGSIVKEEKCRYVRWFMEFLVKLFNSTTLRDYEALDISNIISRLGVFYPPVLMGVQPIEILQAYLLDLTQLTCQFSEGAAKEEALHKDDQLYMEAFEHMLDAWVTILHDAHSLPAGVIQQSSVQIFNQYLHCHISQPDGVRGLLFSEHDNDEIDETEDSDRTRFNDQLAVIGRLGRQAVSHSIPLLTRLLEDRVTKLHGQLQKLWNMSVADMGILESLKEDIHWLVMITGHLLAPVEEGETALIPSEISKYCIEMASNVSLETTLQLLTSPGLPTSDVPGAEQSADHIVRLIASVFRICEVEKRALEANLAGLLSPEVALTLVWFIRRWAVTFLLPNEIFYTEMSMTLTGVFGRDSQGGLWTLNFLLLKLESYLSLWSSEHKLVTESAQALVAMVNNTERGNKTATCESWQVLVKKQADNQYILLPTAAKHAIFKALVIVGTANKDPGIKTQYWESILLPLQERFKATVFHDTFRNNYHSEAVRCEVLDLIECFVGVADGSTNSNLAQLFPFLYPVMEALTMLIDVYHNYSVIVGAIFQFFSVATHRVLCFLNKDDSKSMYQHCLKMIETYALHNAGRVSREASAEEESYQDILVLMRLLTDLLTKDFIHFSSKGIINLHGQASEPQILVFAPGSNEDDTGEPVVSAADVALYGLDVLMPMMTQELLKFPGLCLQYYKLVTLVCEIHPSKICQLSDVLFENLVVTIKMGLTSFTPDVTTLCMDLLSVLAAHVYKTNLQGSRIYNALQPFFSILMDMVLMQSLDTDLFPTMTSTIFAFICCFQETYQDVVKSLILLQTDPAYAQRLTEAFNNLTAGIGLLLNRQNRMKFEDSFEKFVINVRGFLCIK